MVVSNTLYAESESERISRDMGVHPVSPVYIIYVYTISNVPLNPGLNLAIEIKSNEEIVEFNPK